jgi:hypothetical protein
LAALREQPSLREKLSAHSFLAALREQLSNEYLINFCCCALEIKICSPSLARLSDKPIRAHHFEDPDKLGRLERRALSSPVIS